MCSSRALKRGAHGVDEVAVTSPSGSCPRCAVALVRVVSPVGLRLRCPGCGGQAAAESVVARLTSPAEAQSLLRAAAQPFSVEGEALGCPWCAQPMRTVSAPAASPDLGLRIDVCAACQVLWFDHGELEQIPRGTTVRTPSAPRALECDHCGAPCRPDLDAYCSYCGHALAPAQMPVAESTPIIDRSARGVHVRGDDDSGTDPLVRAVRWGLRALRRAAQTSGERSS